MMSRALIIGGGIGGLCGYCLAASAFEADVWYNTLKGDENVSSPLFLASLHVRASLVAIRGAQGGQP